MISQPILIVSPPRSGSSLLSNIIHDAGVFGGIMKPADKWNINGYFENLAITDIVVSYLRKCDTRGLRKKFNPVNLSVPYRQLKAECEAVLKAEGYKDGDAWFYKDPKLCFAWKIFVEAFPNAKWVIVQRDKQQCIDSIMRTDFMDAYQARAQWERYYHTALENIFSLTLTARNVHRADINKIIAGDSAEIEKLSTYLNLPTLSIECFNTYAWEKSK